MKLRPPASYIAVRAMRSLACALLLLVSAVSCVEQGPPGGGEGAKPATDSAVAEAAQPGAGPVPRATQLPGGLVAVLAARPDPGLAATAEPPGRATAHWGESGRNVDGKLPWRPLVHDGIHARDSGAIGILREPQSALRGLPRTISGDFIDWAAALRDGAIRLRARVSGQGQMEVLDRDILLFDTKNMPIVTFPHRTHTEWLACGNCHDWLFKAERGANDISMSEIAGGRACGLCHGKVAFPATECFRRHNGPRPKG